MTVPRGSPWTQRQAPRRQESEGGERREGGRVGLRGEHVGARVQGGVDGALPDEGSAWLYPWDWMAEGEWPFLPPSEGCGHVTAAQHAGLSTRATGQTSRRAQVTHCSESSWADTRGQGAGLLAAGFGGDAAPGFPSSQENLVPGRFRTKGPVSWLAVGWVALLPSPVATSVSRASSSTLGPPHLSVCPASSPGSPFRGSGGCVSPPRGTQNARYARVTPNHIGKAHFALLR